MDNKALLEKAKNGFATIQIQKKYVDSALQWLDTWLSDPEFADYVPQIRYLIEAGKWDLLLDSFYQVIPFGTGGRRGLVGIGPNRINPWTIQASAQGHSQYLIANYGQAAKEKGVVLTYDVRKYTEKGIYDDTLPNPVMGLSGSDLAEAAAEVYAANGIKVYMYEDIRSTPQLSFSIRYLGAIAGDMFSASHNPPTDNGKKVYDSFGGQLIPPYDQKLVDEVTKNVETIYRMPIEEAREKGLIVTIGEEVDQAYWDAVANLSLSDDRNLKIVYSPLHGTGIGTVYPVLRRLGFDISMDPKTSYPSDRFEHVTFHIPNPEVRQSFDTTLAHADEVGADVILNSDPDADRIGIMVRHEGQWQFLTGNEIGIILTQYGISKLKAKGMLSSEHVVVKTDVTSSLIARIAQENGVRCIGNLLVGFKYIGEEMNRLDAAGKMDRFILGTEESHGYIMGNYCRDKDAASAAVWLAELAAELKSQGKTLVDYLKEIYTTYGYCHNYLTEIRLTGAKGVDQRKRIMDYLRDTAIAAFGPFPCVEKIDRWQGPPQPHLSRTDTSSRNVLIFHMADLPNTRGIRVTIRPSGTEPKIKFYIEIMGQPCELDRLDTVQKELSGVCDDLKKAVMTSCYQLLNVDFPERGFLLFDLLPLEDKLWYFEIEPRIADLKAIEDKELKREKLQHLLGFLGANPVQKVDKAFAAKYGQPIESYLDI